MAVPKEIKKSWREFKKEYKEPLYLPFALEEAKVWAQGLQGINSVKVSKFLNKKVQQSRRRLYNRVLETVTPDRLEKVDEKHWKIKTLRREDLPISLKNETPTAIEKVLKTIERRKIKNEIGERMYIDKVNTLLAAEDVVDEPEVILPVVPAKKTTESNNGQVVFGPMIIEEWRQKIQENASSISLGDPPIITPPPKEVKYWGRRLTFNEITGVYTDSRGERFTITTVDRRFIIKSFDGELRYVSVKDVETPLGYTPAMETIIVPEGKLFRKTIGEKLSKIKKERNRKKELMLRNLDIQKTLNTRTGPSLLEEIADFVRNFGVRTIEPSNGRFLNKKGRVLTVVTLGDGSRRKLFLHSDRSYHYLDNVGVSVDVNDLKARVRDNIIGDLIKPFRNLFIQRSENSI
jgi:hypothetical protein